LRPNNWLIYIIDIVGSANLDQILSVLLSTSMFVGGLVGFILDNTVPGTEKERGMIQWRAHLTVKKSSSEETNKTSAHPNTETNFQASTIACYDLPFITNWLRKSKFCRYIPIFPTFLEKKLDASSLKNEDKELERVTPETVL